ncbi:hypothetical protein B0H14DRAFT_3493795 [Mycena olivaceomarginata]|nr:hypothetical protein B0H14DRAFT_3493795 [Mycena olivaceomarginata]
MHDCLKPVYIRTLPFPQQAEAQWALDGPYSVVTAFACKHAQTRSGPDGLGRLPVYYRALDPPPDLINPSPLTPWSRCGSEYGRGFNLLSSAITRILVIPTTPPSPHFVYRSFSFSGVAPGTLPFFTPHVEGVTTIFGRASQHIVLAVPPHVPPHLPSSSEISLMVLGGSRSLALLIAFILTRICPHLDTPPTSTNIQNVGKIAQFLGATTFTGGPSDVWFTRALSTRRPKVNEAQVFMIKGYREKIEAESPRSARTSSKFSTSTSSPLPPLASPRSSTTRGWATTTMTLLTQLAIASDVAATELPPTHPIRLGLALSFVVFYYEFLNSPEC